MKTYSKRPTDFTPHLCTRILKLLGLFAALVMLVLAGCSDGDDGTAATVDPLQPVAEQPSSPDNSNPNDPSADDSTEGDLQFDGAWVSLWTQSQLEQITMGEENILPYVRPDDPLFSEDFLAWDGWPIRNHDGSITVFPGNWVVYIALSSPRGGIGGGGGIVSSWRYWYTNGEEWIFGGEVFGEDSPAFGSRQWAGSTRYNEDTGRVDFYYTAVGDFPEGADPLVPDEWPQGHPAEGRPPVIQQMAVASADIVADEQGVRFENYSDHEVILTADGQIYQTHGDAEVDQVIYGMRDPWHFIHPETAEEYILFTANAAYKPGPHNGVVGLARKNPEGTWELLPPILQAAGTSSQLERPHLILREDAWYLFFTTHDWTFEPEGIGPEGLYGFVNNQKNLRGNWVPLNEGGLVAGNPSIEPAMTYSWLVLPGGHVMSYIKRIPGNDFLAVPAPLFQIEFTDIGATRISDTVTPIGPGIGGTDEDRDGELPGVPDDGDGDLPPGPSTLEATEGSEDPGTMILKRAFELD